MTGRNQFLRQQPGAGWRRAGLVVALIIGLLVGTAGFGYLWGVRVVRVRVLRAFNDLGTQLGRPVAVDRLDISPTQVRLEGLRLATSDGGAVRIHEATVDVDPIAILRGSRTPEAVTLQGVEVLLPYPLPRRGPLADLAKRLRGRSGSGSDEYASAESDAPARRRLPLAPLSVKDATLLVSGPDGQTVARLGVTEASLTPPSHGPGGRLQVRASGRVEDGHALLPRTAWRVDARAHLQQRDWDLLIEFDDPVPLPGLVLAAAGRVGSALDSAAVAGVRVDSAGSIDLKGLALAFGASATPPLDGARIRVGAVDISVGEELTTAASLRRLTAGHVDAVQLDELELRSPRLDTRGEIRRVSVEMAPPPESGGRSWPHRVELVRPTFSVSVALPTPGALRTPTRESPETPAPEDAAPPAAEDAADGAEPLVDAAAPDAAALRTKLEAASRRLLTALSGTAITVVDGELSLYDPAAASADERKPRLVLGGLDIELDRAVEGLTREMTVVGRARRAEEPPVLFSARALASKNGTLRPHSLRLEGPWLGLALGGAHPVLKLAPEAGGSLVVHIPEDFDLTAPRLTGNFDLTGVGMYHPKIARIPVENVSVSAQFEATWDREKDAASLELKGLSLGASRTDVSLRLKRLRGPWDIDLHINFPRQPCDGLLSDIPPAMIPRLSGARLDGTLAFDLKTSVDLAEPDGFKLKLDGDWSQCHGRTLGEHVDVERLQGAFVHRIWEKGERTEIEVGPGTAGYVRLDQIPVPVQQAALATEDMAFFRHEGFRPTLLTRAIRLNLRRGRYVYGGSTISQQLVKNLFLSREKTLSRKLEEAIITWHMERVLSKERILELYLNCIEYGPGIYGLRKASYTYFGVHPSALTPLEGAFIMGLKPDPKSGWNTYRRRIFRRWWRQKMKKILRRLWKDMDVISEDQYRKAAPYVPVFHYPGEGYVRPKATGLTEAELGTPPNAPPMPPRSEAN